MHCLPEPTQPTATNKVSFCEVLIWISGYGSLLVTFCLDLRGWVFSCVLLSRISGDGPLLVSFCPAGVAPDAARAGVLTMEEKVIDLGCTMIELLARGADGVKDA